MIGIYTALFGNYDTLQPAPFDNSIVFTNLDLEVDGWQVKSIAPPCLDLRYASRYYFDQSCLAMPDYEYTIMHGANSILAVDPEKLIEYLPKDIDWTCCAHPRKNVYEEAKACIRMRKDSKDIINKQMDKYRKEGFEGDGLSVLAIIVRRNTPRLKEFEQALWDEVKNNSCRDQLAFEYMRWKMNFPIARIPGHWKNYVKQQRHNERMTQERKRKFS